MYAFCSGSIAYLEVWASSRSGTWQTKSSNKNKSSTKLLVVFILKINIPSNNKILVVISKNDVNNDN